MSTTQLVGILNITPDSFSDGGLFDTKEQALKQAKKILKDGATLIDVGAEATNPYVSPLSTAQEWQRLEPILKELIKRFPGKISVDSYHPETQLKAAKLGPIIINDVTGCNNPKMIIVAAKTQVPIIVSHLPAKFGVNIQAAHQSTDPMTNMEDVRTELLAKKNALVEAGVNPKNIILDPGIGFGKTQALNLQLLHFPEFVRLLDPTARVMIGYSRKRFLGDNRMELEPNLQAGRTAIAASADLLRVHDVAGHRALLV